MALLKTNKANLVSPEHQSLDPLVVRLKNRSDFVEIANGKVVHTRAFVLQARDRVDSIKNIGVGFTCSKRVGNAVSRNAAKRRLKEIARIIFPKYGKIGWDYVLIGKREHTVELKLSLMTEDLKNAVVTLHSKN